MYLSFLWHMHQPDYRDKNGIVQMPWVFLHAIKDYYDMPWMLSRYEGLKATFNITAPLIEQLALYYKEPERSDRFFALWIQDPAHLQEQERQWLQTLCKSAPKETMVKPLPRYAELFEQEQYSDAEFMDLEVLFLLSWCGSYLKQHNKTVQQMLVKAHGYTAADKQVLLSALCTFVSGIWDFYKVLWETGRISLSTTPFYHPILPLLLDMKNAQKANPDTVIPAETLSLKEDARAHIAKAQKLFAQTFGKVTTGMWPAEGAVDEESVDLLHTMGVEWIATDEAILFKSTDRGQTLYAPYSYKGMTIGFRDHRLSDLIGFEYRYKEAQDAAEDFMAQLDAIGKKEPDATVFVILDGENAWEYYPNNGFDFFSALYGTLQHKHGLRTVTMEEVTRMPSKRLSHLAPGSWINGTFDTWVGDREKTRAWELLYLTKKDYAHHETTLTETQKERCRQFFLVAESSDWFWWYGNDHHTIFDREFDQLFRHTLISVYEVMQITPPHDLFMPVVSNQSSKKFWIQPQSDITPTIDGKRNSFFEWMGCGAIDEGRMFSTMEKTKGPVEKIYYGKDSRYVYAAFEGEIAPLCKNGKITVMIDPLGIQAKLAFNQKERQFGNIAVMSACEEWLEMRIDIGTIEDEKILLRFEIEQEGQVIQILPSFGALEIVLHDDYSTNWFV